jgi:ketosteroid isomerase-like protein
MSSSNSETIRTFYDLFLAGKIEEIVERYLADDFVLTNPLPEPIPFGGRYEGSAGFLEYLGQIAAAIEIEEFTLDEVLCDGDHVVVTGRERSLVKPTGRHYTMEWVHVLQISAGRIHSLREYNDTAAMRDAFEAKARN